MRAICSKLSGTLAAMALLAAAPAVADDGIILGGKAKPSGPTAAELAEQAKSQREELEKRASGLATREQELREQAAAEAAAARTACPALIQLKYPWVTCETNEWGRKELVIDGSGSALGVTPMMAPIEGS